MVEMLLYFEGIGLQRPYYAVVAMIIHVYLLLKF